VRLFLRYSTVVVVALVAGLTTTANAESDRLPSTSLGAITGVVAGAGPSAKPLGVGFALGFSAAVQPMRSDQRLGWSLRWSSLFQYQNILSNATAARISGDVRLYQADVVFRGRFAPTDRSGTYLTGGVGLSLLRSNQPVPPDSQRVWAGGIVTLGVDKYVWSGFLLSLDARFGLIGNGPTTIATLLTVGYGL
jgi:hypothetical protein